MKPYLAILDFWWFCVVLWMCFFCNLRQRRPWAIPWKFQCRCTLNKNFFHSFDLQSLFCENTYWRESKNTYLGFIYWYLKSSLLAHPSLEVIGAIIGTGGAAIKQLSNEPGDSVDPQSTHTSLTVRFDQVRCKDELWKGGVSTRRAFHPNKISCWGGP